MRRICVVIASIVLRATLKLLVVAHTVAIGIGCAVTTAHTQGVELAAFAIAITHWDAPTPAFVNGTWSVANSTLIKRAYAIVDVIADAVGILVCSAGAAAIPKCVELVSITIAVTCRNVRTTTLVDVSRTVAYPTNIIHQARSIVGRGVRIVIARLGIGATAPP